MAGQPLDNMTRWAWATAAVRGTSHVKTGVRLQDALCAFEVEKNTGNVFCGMVSDGAGSALFGGEGAALVCRTLSVEIRKFLSNANGLPTREKYELWIDQVRDRIFLAAKKRNLTPRDFAATLVCVVSNGIESTVIHIGDGCAVFQDSENKSWLAPSWPNQGEFASTTYFITDEDLKELRVESVFGPVSSIAIFTDGLERLALNFVERTPFAGFFDQMCRPLQGVDQFGKDAHLSDSLKKYLNGNAINSRTDDDKGLILAVKK